tara:strand:- start:636 stop:1700 length:1065 start_codon:yes stop_codon:yes gene_type:complete
MALKNDKAAAKALAKSIVLAQGSIFVRDLLREARSSYSSVQIGITKNEILENLTNAIDLEALKYNDIQVWISSVEGWGRQHVYLYKGTNALKESTSLKSANALKATLKRLKLHNHWESDAQPEFPEQLTLGRITFDGECLRATWHQRLEKWSRAKSLDHESEEIDGDLVEFRAYRQVLMRSLLRLVVFPKRNKVAIFVQVPLSDTLHRKAKKMAEDLGKKLFDFGALKSVDISHCIKSLDQAEIDAASPNAEHGRITSQNTKFGAGGATVEFKAGSEEVAWKAIGPVRRVRRALQTDSFTGQSGKFEVELASGTGMNRTTTMSLDGTDGRIYFWSQMTESEVWLMLDKLRSHTN